MATFQVVRRVEMDLTTEVEADTLAEANTISDAEFEDQLTGMEGFELVSDDVTSVIKI